MTLCVLIETSETRYMVLRAGTFLQERIFILFFIDLHLRGTSFEVVIDKVSVCVFGVFSISDTLKKSIRPGAFQIISRAIQT